MRMWTLLTTLALCLPTGDTYSMYAERIPNGDHVPHPCKPNFLWGGVGHQNSKGGGARNPFGKDFAANGHKWTVALCRKDSDGDGRTNGQELGDPNCVWTQGQTPPITTNITHPGVCDPWNEGQCVSKNTWVDCTSDETFNCDAIHEPDVMNITLRFPRTKVPAKETTYICFNFQLPDDREYHLIASKPFIDNRNVMHHIVLSRCDDSAQLIDKPQECLMGVKGCFDMLDIWSLGMTGSCMLPDAGYSIGKGHSRIVSMQMHWTNPSKEDTWFDSSGMVLYYTPKLRRHNAGILGIGQLSLNIPPGQNHWVERGACSAQCTERQLKGDIHLFRLFNHMHYLGNRQNVTLIRKGGSQEEVLADDDPYRYDSPVSHAFDPVIPIYPGDELRTYCQYQSRSRAKTTQYGEGSFDEMCFSFLFFYPKEKVDDNYCLQYKEVDGCVASTLCGQMYNSSSPPMAAAIQKIMENCDASGATCRVECRGAVQEVMQSNRCLREAWSYFLNKVYTNIWDPVMLKFMTAIRSCGDPRDAHEVTPQPSTTVGSTEPSKPEVPGGPGSWFLDLVKHLDARPLLQNIIMNVNYNNGAAKKGDDNDHDRVWH